MYKAVIFDLDGTLLNTLEDLADSTNYALEKNGFNKRTLEEIRRFVGNGNIKLMQRALPENASESQFDKAYADFCEHYKHNMANKTRAYDGIDDMLKALYNSGKKLAIVTNKIDFAAQELCGNLFGDYVKTVVGSDGIRPNKPAPDGLLYALDKLGVDKSEAVFVGDSEVDIATANNAQMDCIGVLWGFRDREQLEKIGVKTTVSNSEELCNKLLFD